MRGSTFSNLPLLREKKKPKKSTLKEPKRLDLRKLRIKRELWLKFKERESRF